MARKSYNKNGCYPGEPLSIEDKRRSLYHYTSFETFVKIWFSKKLLFGPAKNLNDILESHKILLSNNFDNEVFGNFRKLLSEYRQISLTMDYDSYIKGCMSDMMWAHYGKSGTGVCIELDWSKLDFMDFLHKPIEYLNYKPLLPILPSECVTKEEIQKYIDLNIDNFFFKKTMDWKDENEYRIITNSKLEGIDISSAIKAVYIIDEFSSTCRAVEKIVCDEVPVMCYFHNADTGGNRLVPRYENSARRRESREEREIRTNVSFDLTQYELVGKYTLS